MTVSVEVTGVKSEIANLEEEVARKNAKKFHGSNLYSMIFKEDEE
jgi:hypothetical protein